MYVKTNLGRLFYTEEGTDPSDTGEAIVLLHGYLFDGRMFRAQRAPLAGLGRVLTFDLPGHGKSEVPPFFTLEDNADAMRDAFTELGIKKAVIVGLSWGGFLGMRIALRHPDVVRSLVLMNTTAEVDNAFSLLQTRAFVLSLRHGMCTMSRYLKFVAPASFGREFWEANREVVEQSGRDMLGFDPEGLYRAGMAALVNRQRILEKLVAIRAPTLVLGGNKDRATPPAASHNLAKTIPGARLVMLECGHMSTLEKPHEVNETIVPFIKTTLGS